MTIKFKENKTYTSVEPNGERFEVTVLHRDDENGYIRSNAGRLYEIYEDPRNKTEYIYLIGEGEYMPVMYAE